MPPSPKRVGYTVLAENPPTLIRDSSKRQMPPPRPLPTTGTQDASEKATSVEVDVPTNQRLASVARPGSSVVRVKLDFSGQHTISWSESLCAPSGAADQLPAGECNLYRFPTVSLANGEGEVDAQGVRLAILREIITGLCLAGGPSSDATSDAALVPDASGAYLMHGLLIANSDEAVGLALGLLERRSELISQAHAPGHFAGENILHVLAVNQRQADVRRLLGTALQCCEDVALESLLTSQATGAFFRSEPMRSYGGSPFAYACAFRATHVVTAILTQPRLRALVMPSLASPGEGLDVVNPCPISGYFPIHAAVAHGRTDIYDLLVEHGADPQARTRAPLLGQGLPGLSPIQLACFLGDAKMFEYLLVQQLQVEWKWGPVVSYKLPLMEIDSSGPSLHDVMEIILLPDAKQQTREMILDEFMGGFIFQLFQQKWHRFGRRQHTLFRLLDLCSLGLVLYLGFSLKEAPLTADRWFVPVLTIVFKALELFYEVLKVACGRHRSRQFTDVGQLRKIITHLLAIIGCTSVLLHTHPPEPDGAGDEISWALLSVANFFTFSEFVSVLFVPNQQMGIFALVVQRLLATDVQIFLIFFFLYLGCFWSTLYINYPRAGEGTLNLVPQFNNVFASFEAMLNLGIAGLKFDIDFFHRHMEELNEGERLNLWLFTLFYYYCIILLILVLLRMLMAMLTATFASVRTAATLEWRLQFARHILQHELIAMRSGGETYAGEKLDGEWYYTFRARLPMAIDDDSPQSPEPSLTGPSPLSSQMKQPSRSQHNIFADSKLVILTGGVE